MSMNGSGENNLNENSGTPDTKSCSIIDVIPTLGMSSCRGRAEAFARSLSSKLRTLGSQSDDGALSQEEESIINDNNDTTNNTWRTRANDSEQAVTDLQPLRHESDSFFDFDCELESPGSPADECEYLRLIETASNTPRNSATESGYICASTASSRGSATDITYFEDNIENSNDEDTIDGTAKCAPTTTHHHNGYDIKEYEHELEDHVASASITSKSCLEDAENKAYDNTTTTTHEEEHKNLAVETQNTPTTAAANNLSPVDLATIQDDIINELQEHSERIGTLIESIQTQANTEINTVVNVSESTYSTNHSNGKPESTDDNLVNENLDNTIHNANSKQTTEQLKLKIEKSSTAQNEVQTGLDTNVCDHIINSQEINIDTKTTTTIATPTNHIINISKDEEGGDGREGGEGAAKSSSFAENDDDEDDCRPQRVRRCSSLKTGKTPPGTPGRKKIVRFADVLGLDLADIKTFLDEIPTIPKSAFEDLEVLESEPPIQLGPKSDKLLVPLFQQPGGLPNFLDFVREKQVSLENAAVTDHINQTITGTVRVRNLDFHKSVHIRYSLDNWRSYADLQANYVENSCDGFSDKFTFFLFGNSLRIGQRIEFAVRFQCKGQQFWDSNYGTNYCFQCLPASTPQSGSSRMTSQPIHAAAASHYHDRNQQLQSSGTAGLFSPTVGDTWCSSFY